MAHPVKPSRGKQLPVKLTPFIGRIDELNNITRLLSDPACRLLTLLGPGGIGKTRLAIEAAQRMADHFKDGVYWVDLQPVDAADFLVTAMADAFSLTLSRQNDPDRQLLEYLKEKTILVVLDNFEQLVEGGAFLSEVLYDARGIKLLVTSRIALNLQEEFLYPVRGLSYPSAGQETLAWPNLARYDAVQLFIERVRRVRPGFSPQDEKVDVLRICKLVEGMPLALELAAAWARSLDFASIAEEIQHSLAFLSSPMRNVPERHYSMEAVFAHTWTLLGSDEREVFPNLAVFRGGFRRHAAEAVAGATLPLLTSLVDKSLLRWQTDGRYQMHELLRQYAGNRLNRSSQETFLVHQRHSAFYLDFLTQRGDAIIGNGQRDAAAEIAAELDNIRAAWGWAVHHQEVRGIGSAIASLSMFCQIRSRYLDAAMMYDDALRNLNFSGTEHEKIRAILHSELGWIAIRLGQFEKAKGLFRICQDIYARFDLMPPPGQATDPLLGFGILATIEGDYVKAKDLTQHAYQNALAQNNLANLEYASYQLASIAYARGDYENAKSWAQAAYDICEQVGDHWFMGYCLNEMGRVARVLGNYTAARQYFETSYNSRESFLDPEGMAVAELNLGEVALLRGQLDEARKLFEHCAAVYRDINDRGGLAAAFHGLGRTAFYQGDIETAQSRLSQALKIAAGIWYLPVLLSILVSVSRFLLRTGRLEQGLAMLELVQEHPAADQETKRSVRRLLHERASRSPALFRSTLRIEDLETAIITAQRELAAPIPSHLEEEAELPLNTSLVEPLTERELEVLDLIARGLTNREIAERLSVVTGTIKAHNNRIFGKLGVKNRVAAVARARELGLIL